MTAAALTSAVQALAPSERKTFIDFLLDLLRDVAREYADDVALAVAEWLDTVGDTRTGLSRVLLGVASRALRWAAPLLAGSPA